MAARAGFTVLPALQGCLYVKSWESLAASSKRKTRAGGRRTVLRFPMASVIPMPQGTEWPVARRNPDVFQRECLVSAHDFRSQAETQHGLRGGADGLGGFMG